MPRDYAAPRRRKAKRGGLSGGTGLFIGLLIGLGIAAWVWFRQPAPPLATPPPAQVDEPPAAAPANTPLPERRFTFYELLPNQERLVPDPLPEAERARAEPGDTAVYVIQAASFSKSEDAERHKANLALLGLESRVEKVTIDNRDTYYRVRVGPVTGRTAAERVLDQLEDNGLSGMVVKLR